MGVIIMGKAFKGAPKVFIALLLGLLLGILPATTALAVCPVIQTPVTNNQVLAPEFQNLINNDNELAEINDSAQEKTQTDSDTNKDKIEPKVVPVVYVMATSAVAVITRVAASPATTRILTNLTRSNFRENLIRYTGGNPGTVYQAHHMLPNEFESFFIRAGMQIHHPKYGTWVHQSYHSSINYQYNQTWSSFRASNPNATAAQIESYARSLAQQYSLYTNF